jgi:lipid-A-disaccharide synthase
MDEAIVPEIFQGDVTPEKIAAAALPLLQDTELRKTMIARLKDVKTRLGTSGATVRISNLLKQSLSQRQV